MRRTPPSTPAPGRRLLGLAVAAILLTPLHVAGQADARATPGLWWGASVGAGSAHLTCDLCETNRDFGPSVDLAVGAWARPDLRIGLEGGGWTHDDDGGRETVYRAGLVAHLRPGSRGLFLTGGLGWSGYRAGDFNYDAARLTLGAGWDLPLTAGWVVGNTLSVDAASFGKLRNDDTTVSRDVGLSVLRFAIHVRSR